MKSYGWILVGGEKQKVHIKEYHPDLGGVTDDLGRALVPKEDCFLIWPGEHYAKVSSPRREIDETNSGGVVERLWREIWQSYSPSEYLELDFEVDHKIHTVDLIDKMGYIVELQHSNISLEEVQKREEIHQKMYWIVDASRADWIHLNSLVDESEVKSISKGYILVKERKVWWSYFNRAMFLDLGVGLGCIEKVYYSPGMSRYYLCRLCSYEYFLQSLFHLKPDFELNPIHQVSIDSVGHPSSSKTLHDLEYSVRLDQQSIQIDCSSHWTYQHKELLEQFGMRRCVKQSGFIPEPRRSGKFTLRLFYSKERAQHEEVILECRELVQEIRQSLESEYKARIEELEEITNKLDVMSSL